MGIMLRQMVYKKAKELIWAGRWVKDSSIRRIVVIGGLLRGSLLMKTTIWALSVQLEGSGGPSK